MREGGREGGAFRAAVCPFSMCRVDPGQQMGTINNQGLSSPLMPQVGFSTIFSNFCLVRPPPPACSSSSPPKNAKLCFLLFFSLSFPSVFQTDILPPRSPFAVARF